MKGGTQHWKTSHLKFYQTKIIGWGPPSRTTAYISAVLSPGEDRPVLLLYRKGTEEIVSEIPFPEDEASGHFYSMKVKLRPAAYEYNYRAGSQIFTDPCARKIAGRSVFGELPSASPHAVRSGFVWKKFDWEDDQYPNLSYSDTVMYHLHVRGFTKQKNSGVRKKGTFAGIREKAPVS